MGRASNRHRRSALVAIALALGALLAGCGSPGHAAAVDGSGLPVARPVLESDLIHRPQARLYFPHSTVERRAGSDQTPNRDGEEPNPAYVATVLTASTTAGQLLAWYSRQLARSGFTPTRYYVPSNQSTGAAWAFHNRLQVQVGVLRTEGPTGEKQLTYEEYLVGYAPGLPKD